MKTKEKELAIKLRLDGKSVRDIANSLGVSKSSVSAWVRNIILTDNQIKNLQNKNAIYDKQFKGAKKRQENAKQQRLLHRQEGALIAKRKEFLHSFGCALYWGEGSKGRTACSFANSDPFMLKMFLNFLQTYFPDKTIKVWLNCYSGNGLTISEIENYWSNTLSIPKENFYKSTVDNVSKYSAAKKAKNKLLYGTVTLRIYSIEVVQHIFGAIEEYGSFSSELGLW